MIEFWLLALILLVCAIAVLWLPAWRYRPGLVRGSDSQTLEVTAFQSRLDELETERTAGRISDDEYHALKTELERNLLQNARVEAPASVGTTESRGWPLALGLTVFMVVITAGFYHQLGSSGILTEMEQQQAFAERLVQMPSAKRVVELEQVLESSPGDIDINYLLAREYMQLKNYGKAREVYRRLVNLTDGHPGVLAEFAQASFFMDGNRLTDESRDLVSRSIARQPDNATALGLLGIDAFENKRYQEAISYWQRIIENNPAAPEVESLRVGIARARALAGETPELAAAAGPQLQVNVSLAGELLEVVAPEQTLFVFARAVEGPPMPLAAVRLQARDLPADIVLNDALAMSPMAKLSSVEEVNLVARISRSGTPQAQSGDLEGTFGPINVNSAQSNIKLVIDKVVE